MKQLFVKSFARKNADATARYNADKLHPDHKHTYIMERFHYASNGLNSVGGWNMVDEYESLTKKSADKNNSLREYIITLDNRWASQPEQVESFTAEIKRMFADKLHTDDDHMLMEIQYHHNNANDNEKENFHVHVMVSERVLVDQKKQKTYKRDMYQSSVTGKLCKKDDPAARLIHKKGELMYKDGQPVYEAGGHTHLSAKNPDFKSRQFLQDIKVQTAAIMEQIDSSLDLQVGRKPETLPVISWNRAEQKTHPERIETAKQINDLRRSINRMTADAIQDGIYAAGEVATMNREHLERNADYKDLEDLRKKTAAYYSLIEKEISKRSQETLEDAPKIQNTGRFEIDQAKSELADIRTKIEEILALQSKERAKLESMKRLSDLVDRIQINQESIARTQRDLNDLTGNTWKQLTHGTEIKEKTALLDSLKQKWREMMAQLRKVLKMPDKQTHPSKMVMSAARSIICKIPQQQERVNNNMAELKRLRATERLLVDKIVSHDFLEAREASDRRRELGLTRAAVQRPEH